MGYFHALVLQLGLILQMANVSDVIQVGRRYTGSAEKTCDLSAMVC
jgi:hypothetical protein